MVCNIIGKIPVMGKDDHGMLILIIRGRRRSGTSNPIPTAFDEPGRQKRE